MLLNSPLHRTLSLSECRRNSERRREEREKDRSIAPLDESTFQTMGKPLPLWQIYKYNSNSYLQVK